MPQARWRLPLAFEHEMRAEASPDNRVLSHMEMRGLPRAEASPENRVLSDMEMRGLRPAQNENL